MITEFDTIAAISTGLSEGGIGIIRVSGSNALCVVNQIFVNSAYEKALYSFQPNSIHFGFIVDMFGMQDDKEDISHYIVDEVMVSYMKAPHSYTTEDTIEINCHGGIVVLNRILELVLRSGARLADPGEFTKRAFLNGRIDLSKAEAVMDLISAQNAFAAKSSVSQLHGSVSSFIHSMREKILYEIAYIESALDDPEHISLDGYKNRILQVLDDLLNSCEKIIHDSKNGKILSDGIRCAIVGKPNAGKSSILNALLRENRAIVTDVAGTTRDSLEEKVRIGNLSLLMIDTAGIRETDDVVEKIGVRKSKDEIEKADLILFVCDSSTSLDQNDEEILDLLSKLQDTKGIILLNKSDLVQEIHQNEDTNLEEAMILTMKKSIPSYKVVRTSAVSEDGIHQLEEVILSLFMGGQIHTNENEIFMTNMRHLQLMEACMQSLHRVKESVSMDMPEDFLSIDLTDAYVCLGKIIGEEISDDVVNEIFAKFCMGK